MKRTEIIIFLIVLLFSRCTKESGDPDTLKFYGDAFEDIGYSVTIAADGYIIAGQLENIERTNGVLTDTTADKDMAVIKTDWQGNVKWKTSLGGENDDYGSKIYQLGDGSYICVGTLTDASDPGNEKEILIAKLSSGGDILWQKTYGGTGNQEGRDIVETSYGFMVLGATDIKRVPLSDSTGNIEGSSDIYVMKINGNGDFLFSFATGYPNNDHPTAIKSTGGDNCIVLGTTDRSWKDQDKKNLILIQIYPSGTSAGATRIIGTKEDEYAADIEVLSDGYLLAGTVGAKGGEQEGLAVRLQQDIFDPLVYSKKFKIANTSTAINAISRYGTDSYVLGGYSGISNSSRMLIFEMNPDGNLPSGSQIIMGSSGEQVINDVVSGDDGYIIAVGKNKYDINSMIAFLKIKF